MKILTTFVFLALAAGCASSQRHTASNENAPWAEVSRELVASSDRGATSAELSAQIAKELPELQKQIDADKNRSDWLALWGRSVNFDEYAKGVVVPPAIIQVLLAELGQAPAEGSHARIVHAGTEHTYGYLFSNLVTPFGFKRARWVRPTLDRGFGMTSPTLSAMPTEGTLLGNITAFIGRIAFRRDPNELGTLMKSWEIDAPAAVRDFDFNRLSIQRLEETVREGDRRVVLRTDLVHFPRSTGDSNTDLLIYSIIDSKVGGARLISAFPVNAGFADQMFKPQPIRVRYNAYVEGMNDRELQGTRKKL